MASNYVSTPGYVSQGTNPNHLYNVVRYNLGPLVLKLALFALIAYAAWWAWRRHSGYDMPFVPTFLSKRL